MGKRSFAHASLPGFERGETPLLGVEVVGNVVDVDDLRSSKPSSRTLPSGQPLAQRTKQAHQETRTLIMLPAFARTGLRAASMPRPMMASTSSRVTQQLAVRRSYATDRTGQRGDAKAKLVSFWL